MVSMATTQIKIYIFFKIGIYRSLGLLVACTFLTSCAHYQFGHGEIAEQYSTISIPTIEGDQKGKLLTAVIKQFALSGSLRYVEEDGDLILQIKYLETDDDNIGYRYDRKKRGGLKKTILPSETRITALVEVQLIDALTQRVVRPLTRLNASVDLDHTYYSNRHGVNIFSLGQLNDIDAAKDMAIQGPLNRIIAEKITEYILNSW
jgi:hypothetical protein